MTLTDRPETARWLSAEEKELAIARVRSERVATTEVLDRMDSKKLMQGILSPVTLSTSFLFLLNNITVQGLAFFAPTIVRTIYPDKSTVMQQLFTVPPYVVGGFFTLALPLLSWYLDKRQIIMILTTPLVIVGYSMFLGTTNSSARYAATFLLSSSLFAMGPLANSQVSANVVSDTARTSAIGLNGKPLFFLPRPFPLPSPPLHCLLCHPLSPYFPSPLLRPSHTPSFPPSLPPQNHPY